MRDLGLALGLPRKFVMRHPFPGPGLGVRCLCCEDDKESVDNLKISAQINDLLTQNELKGEILPIKSVGV